MSFIAASVEAKIQPLAGSPLSAFDCKKFQIDAVVTLVTTSALVTPTSISRRLMTWRLIKSLTSFAQHTE
jgi:hypothetical protein